jgi:hypothetical protein
MPTWSEPVEGQGTAHDFKSEPELIATYLGTDQIEARDSFGGGTRETAIHRFRKPSGEPVDVWGSTDLDAKVRGITEGTLMRITYRGTEPLDNDRSIKRYTVQWDKDSVPTPVASGQTDDIPF